MLTKSSLSRKGSKVDPPPRLGLLRGEVEPAIASKRLDRTRRIETLIHEMCDEECQLIPMRPVDIAERDASRGGLRASKSELPCHWRASSHTARPSVLPFD